MATSRQASGFNVGSAIEQAVQALRRSQHTTVRPEGLATELLVAAEILGQDPGRRRLLGPDGIAFATAWAQPAAAAGRVAVVRGDFQVAALGTRVAIPPAVVVTDSVGRPRGGINGTVTVSAGGGSCSPAAVTSGERGIAEVGTWTLGPTPGPNGLRFTFGAESVDVTAFAVATRRCDIVDGDGQSAVHGTALNRQPAVKVVDIATGLAVAGVTVTFQVTSGGGTVANATAQTDQDGTATAGIWTLGSVKGTNTLEATVLEAAPATFTAQAT